MIKRDARKWWLPLIATLGVSILSFLSTNPGIFSNFDAFLRGLGVEHYQPAQEWLHGRFFYFNVVLFASFGVLGAVLYLCGAVAVLRRELELFLLLTGVPVFLVVYLGRFDLLFTRNMVLAMPFVLTVGAVGAETILGFISRAPLSTKARSGVMILVSLLFLVEPVSKSLYAVKRDLSLDSRTLAKAWLLQQQNAQKIPADAKILSNPGCHFPPLVRSARTSDANPCFDYLVLDTWFGGIRNDGSVKENDETLSRVVSEWDFKFLHYLAHYQIWQHGPVKNYLTERHHAVARFRGYGPTVFVFKREPMCPKVPALADN